MPNNRIKQDGLEAIVDDRGRLVGFSTPSQDDDVFFARALGSMPAVTHTGTTAKTKVGSIAIPNGSIGPNGMVRLTPFFTLTNNANAKTITYELNATQIAALSRPSAGSESSTVIIKNKGNHNNQTVSVGTTFVATLTQNMASDAVLDVYVTLGVGTDTVTFHGALVEVVPCN